MAVAADDAVDLIRRHAGLVHRLPAGQDGVGAQRLVHRDAVPAPIDRRMSNAGHSDLAAVLPSPEPVLISPPLIPVWRGHGSTFPLCSGDEGMAGTNPLALGDLLDALKESSFSLGVDPPGGWHTLGSGAEIFTFSSIIEEAPTPVFSNRREQMVIGRIEIGVVVLVEHNWLT